MIKALLMVTTYTESLLNDENSLDSHSDSLYRILTLMAYTEVLLKDGSALDDHSDSLYRISTLRLGLHGGSPERWERSWRSL